MLWVYLVSCDKHSNPMLIKKIAIMITASVDAGIYSLLHVWHDSEIFKM